MVTFKMDKKQDFVTSEGHFTASRHKNDKRHQVWSWEWWLNITSATVLEKKRLTWTSPLHKSIKNEGYTNGNNVHTAFFKLFQCCFKILQVLFWHLDQNPKFTTWNKMFSSMTSITLKNAITNCSGLWAQADHLFSHFINTVTDKYQGYRPWTEQ